MTGWKGYHNPGAMISLSPEPITQILSLNRTDHLSHRIQGFSDPQDHNTTATFSLAGGKTLGQKAFLLGYRSPNYSISFAPPTTIFPFSIQTPFCYEEHDSKAGTLSLRADNLMRTRRIVINVIGPAVGVFFFLPPVISNLDES